MKKLLFVLLLLLSLCAAAFAKEGWLCEDGECAPMISAVKYHGWDAFRLTDGQTEAIVVPAIGRVMSFGRVGEKVGAENWLWSAPEKSDKVSDWGGWKNWGGEKTWLAPQSNWDTLNGTSKKWPPPPQWDQLPFEAEVLSGGHLKLTGAVAPASGTRIIREFWHDEDGNFNIRQTVEKLRGAPLVLGLWNVAQIDNSRLEAVFLPRAQNSDYTGGFLALDKTGSIAPKSVTPALLQVVPAQKGSYKIGTDAPVAAVAALRDGWAFITTTSRPDGEYPDGEASKSGTPVQLFGMGSEKLNYLELELLSPLRTCVAGSRWTQTVKWRLEKMPSSDINDAALHAAIQEIFASAA